MPNMKAKRILPLLLLMVMGSTMGALASIVWTRQIGGNLEVLVAQYGAELYEDPECTVKAISVLVKPTEQGRVGKSEILYLKITGGGRMFIYYDFEWLSVSTVDASAEFSWDGATWQKWDEGVLNFIDMDSGDVAQVRWTFTIPAIEDTGVYQYEIVLRGDNVVPSG